MKSKLASYRTIAGALRYAKELKAAYPAYEFMPMQHPSSFAYTVAMKQNGVHLAYVLCRPRGGVRALQVVSP